MVGFSYHQKQAAHFIVVYVQRGKIMYTYTEEEIVEMATKTGTCLGYTTNIINDLEDLDIDDRIKVRLKIVEDILTKFWGTP